MIRVALLMAVAALAACADDATGPGAPLPPQTALDSLVAVDGDTLPCCAEPLRGGTVTVVGGSLVYYYPTNAPDTVFTPVGPLPRSCVVLVPNGIAVGDGYAILPDSSRVPAPPCTAGEYRLILTRRYDFPGFPTRIDHVTIASGDYTWRTDSTWVHDTLSLTDSTAGPLVTAVAGLRISVTLGGHQYQLQVVPGN